MFGQDDSNLLTQQVDWPFLTNRCIYMGPLEADIGIIIGSEVKVSQGLHNYRYVAMHAFVVTCSQSVDCTMALLTTL